MKSFNDFLAQEYPLFCKNQIGTCTLYHYTSPAGMMGILNSNNPKLYFSQYDSLNDLKERKDIMEFVSGYCDFKAKEKTMSVELAEKIKSIELTDNFLITEIQKEEITLQNGETINELTAIKNEDCYTYICSFSEKPDLLPMWRMYCKSEHYEGYCLGFHDKVFQHDSCYEKGYNIELKKVIYNDRDKTKLLDNFLTRINKYYSNSTKEDKNIFFLLIKNFIFDNQFIFKDKAFEYEKEIRAILHIPKKCVRVFDNISERKYRMVNGIIVPYVEFEIPHNDFFRINMAPSIKASIAENNLKDFLSSKGYDHIRIYQSNIPIRSC